MKSLTWWLQSETTEFEILTWCGDSKCHFSLGLESTATFNILNPEITARWIQRTQLVRPNCAPCSRATNCVVTWQDYKVFRDESYLKNGDWSVWLFSQDTRLSLIATDQNYRQNFTAADNTRSTQMGTIKTIIEMIVCLPFFPLVSCQHRFLFCWLKHQFGTNVCSLLIFSDKWDQRRGTSL